MATESTATAPKEPGATTADRVWTVAASLFREKGYHASTTRELAERLQITRASLYYHVAKKEDLLYGICVESLRRVAGAVEEALDGIVDPIDRIRLLVRTHVSSMLNDIDMHSTMLLDLQQLQGDQLTEVLKLRNDYEAVVRAVVADARSAGALRDDISLKDTTLALLNLMNWTISWYRPGRTHPGEFAKSITEIFLSGARSSS